MSSARFAAQELFGRTEVIGQLSGRLGGLREGVGGVATLVAEPGMGKTAVIESVVSGLEDVRVLRCCGLEAEVELPYGSLDVLLRPVRNAIACVEGFDCSALASALTLGRQEPASAVAVAMGALTLLSQVCQTEGAIVIVVDDLQWIDEATLQVLGFIARRIEHDPIFLLAAGRPGERTKTLGAAATVGLGPLLVDDVARLVRRESSQAVADRAAEALHAATGGNPLAVIEAVRMLGPSIEHFDAGLFDASPPGGLVKRSFSARLDGLSEEARLALLVVAEALDSEATTIVAAISQLGLPSDVLGIAEEQRLIERSAGQITFSHPLLRAAVRKAPAKSRRRVSAALSMSASERGARAWHAAAASDLPNEAVAAELEAVAHDFEALGGSTAAATALERAARLTPEPEVRAERLVSASIAARYGGSLRWSAALSNEAKQLARDPVAKLNITYQALLRDAASRPTQETLARYLQLAQAASGIDDQIAIKALWAAALEGTVAGQQAIALTAIKQLAALTGDAPGVEAQATIGAVLVLTGADPQKGRAQLVQAAARRVSEGFAGDNWMIEPLTWIEEFPLAEQLAVGTIDRSRALGDLLHLCDALWMDGYLKFRTGRWTEAGAALEEAIQLADEMDEPWPHAMAAGFLAVLRSAQGDPSAAALASTAQALARERGYAILEPAIATAAGLAAMGDGDHHRAIEAYQQAADWTRQSGENEPCMFSWQADLAECYLAAGDPARAASGADTLRRQVQATGRQTAVAALRRVEGILCADDRALALLDESVDTFDGLGATFEAARSRLILGQRQLNTDRRQAVAVLRRAARDFQRLGAQPWARQTRTALSAAGDSAPAPPLRRRPALTSQEQAIAKAVSEGLTNRQVAARFFLTQKTVEWHLSNIYRKLEIRSRRQLAQHAQAQKDTRA